MVVYALDELQTYIRQVLALNFPEAVWLQAEIAQATLSKGHYYLSLVQKSETTESIIAHAEAILWSKTHRRLRRQSGKNIDALLQSGMEIKCQVQIDYHERYGLKFHITDVDVAHALGQFALRREAIVRKLEKQGLLRKNASVPLPPVLQRIAVISSPQAAGLQDYLAQLQQNPYNYAFENVLFPAAVQGTQVVKEVSAAFRHIAQKKDAFDAIVLIRGGGSRIDLAAFDDFDLCKTIANAPLPVLVGIGHETDSSLPDLVAHRALKTPTAVAQFLVQHNIQYEGMCQYLFSQVAQLAQQQVQTALRRLETMRGQIEWLSKDTLQQAQYRQQQLTQILRQASHQQVLQAHTQLAYLEKIIQLLSVDATLGRGFSVIYKDHKLAAPSTLKVGDIINIQLYQQRLKSIIQKIDYAKEKN